MTENSSEPENRPPFPGELPPLRDEGLQLPKSIQDPSTRSGETSIPAEAVEPYPSVAPPPATQRSYEDILNEARGAAIPGFETPPAAEAQPSSPQDPFAQPNIPGFQTPASTQAQEPSWNSNANSFPSPQAQYANPGQAVNYNAQPAESTNVVAIVALVLSFLCMGLFAIPLGIVALFQIKKSGQKGKGLAIAAIVVSVVTMLLAIIATVGLFAFIGNAVDECESGNPSPDYASFCEDYNSSQTPTDTNDPYGLNSDRGFSSK